MKKSNRNLRRIRGLTIITFILIVITFMIIKINHKQDNSIAEETFLDKNQKKIEANTEVITVIPTVNGIYDKDTKIEGEAQANSVVLVEKNDELIGVSQTNDKGKFIVNIPIQKSGVQLNISCMDKNGNRSNSVKLNVEQKDRPKKVILDVPIFSQLPELPRGCEVTSLSMLLKYYGINIDKLEIAKQIKKDTTPYKKDNNEIYFGNPNDGFVGDMYNLKNPGLGVYHKPIYDLAFNYLPNSIIDITGSSFEDILDYISSGNPVLVINTSRFKALPDEYWEEWNTPTGKIKVTLKEHAVVITGYDEQYIYFNDPLANKKNRKILRKEFEEGWIQMGNQAITAIQ